MFSRYGEPLPTYYRGGVSYNRCSWVPQEPDFPILNLPEFTGDGRRSEFQIKEMSPFNSDFVKCLLYNKHIVFIGDSLTRGLYKDTIRLLQEDDPLPNYMLRKKTEMSHLGDRQIDFLPLDKDRVFRQAREYSTASHLIQFFFTSRAMKNDIEGIFNMMRKTEEFPDVIVVNSALWDLTRYWLEITRDPMEPGQIENEKYALEDYAERISMLMRRFRLVLPPTTQVIWILFPWIVPMPPSKSKNSGLYQGIDAYNYNDRKKPMTRTIYNDGNYRAAQIVRNAGYDVLDLGFYMRNHSFYLYRTSDGVHWNRIGTRFMTQLLIGHLSKNLILFPESVATKLNYFRDWLRRNERNYQMNHGCKFLNNCNKAYNRELASPALLQKEFNVQILRFLPPTIRNVIRDDIRNARMINFITRNSAYAEFNDAELELFVEKVKGGPEILSICREILRKSNTNGIQRMQVGGKKSKMPSS